MRPTHSLLASLRPYWRVFWRLRQMHLARTLEFRANFFFWGVVSAMWTIFNFFFFSLLASLNQGIAGWTSLEITVLLGVFSILDVFMWSWAYHCMNSYTQSVFSGEFSGWLLKPISPAFMILTKENNYNNIFRLVLGFMMLAWAIPQLPTPPTLLDYVGASLALLGGLTFAYSLWFGLATLAFWMEKFDNINEIMPTVRRFWQVPRQVYEHAGAGWLSTILPIALVVSIPAEVLLGRPVWGWVGYLWLVALLTLSLSLAFFRVSLKRYGATGG